MMYKNELQMKINESFKQLDSLHRRGGLNSQQFFFLLEKDCNLSLKQSFGIKTDDKHAEFVNILQTVEFDESMHREELISLSTIHTLVFSHNISIYPFSGYFHFYKYYKSIE